MNSRLPEAHSQDQASLSYVAGSHLKKKSVVTEDTAKADSIPVAHTVEGKN